MLCMINERTMFPYHKEPLTTKKMVPILFSIFQTRKYQIHEEAKWDLLFAQLVSNDHISVHLNVLTRSAVILQLD